MKLIVKSRENAIKGHLASFTEVTYHTHENNYKGETVKQPLDAGTQRLVFNDIMEGQAKLWYNGLNDTFELHYAYPCKWVLKR